MLSREQKRIINRQVDALVIGMFLGAVLSAITLALVWHFWLPPLPDYFGPDTWAPEIIGAAGLCAYVVVALLYGMLLRRLLCRIFGVPGDEL